MLFVQTYGVFFVPITVTEHILLIVGKVIPIAFCTFIFILVKEIYIIVSKYRSCSSLPLRVIGEFPVILAAGGRLPKTGSFLFLKLSSSSNSPKATINRFFTNPQSYFSPSPLIDEPASCRSKYGTSGNTDVVNGLGPCVHLLSAPCDGCKSASYKDMYQELRGCDGCCQSKHERAHSWKC